MARQRITLNDAQLMLDRIHGFQERIHDWKVFFPEYRSQLIEPLSQRLDCKDNGMEKKAIELFSMVETREVVCKKEGIDLLATDERFEQENGLYDQIKFEAFVKDFDAMKRYIMAPDVAEIEKREHIISGLRKRQSDLNSQLSDATNKIQELEQQKEDCEEKAKEKVQEIAELLDDWVEDCEDLHAEIQRLQTRVNKKDENTAELQASCVTLNIQLEEIKSELATKNTLVTQLFATQQQLQNQLVDEKNRMDEQLRNRQDRLDHEENWLRMIEDNLKDQKDCVEKLSAENQSLYDDKVLLIKDTKRLKQEVSAKEAKINNLVLWRTEDYKKISPLQRKLDAAEAEKFELKEDVLELESQLQHVKRDLTNLIDHDRGQQDTERVQTVIANITLQLQRRQGGLRRAPSTPNPRPSNSRPSPRPQSRRNPQGATLAQETIIDLIITLSDSQIEELELLSSIREYQEEARLGRHWVKGHWRRNKKNIDDEDLSDENAE